MTETAPSDHIDGPDVLGVVQAPPSTGREDVFGIIIPVDFEDMEVIPTADPSRVIIALPNSQMPDIRPGGGPIRAAWAAALEGVFMQGAAALGRWLDDHPDHGTS